MTDGPFLTIDHAKAQVAVEKVHNAKCNFTIFIKEGTYFLDRPISFAPVDSAADDYSITYAGYPGEKPVISGGRQVNGQWSPSKTNPNIWELYLTDVAAGKWYFQQLFVNGSRRRRANSLELPQGKQLPSSPEAYQRIQSKIDNVNTSLNRTGFIYRVNDFNANWHNLEDSQIVMFYAWNTPRKWIDVQRTKQPESIARHTLFFTSPTSRPSNDSGGGKDEHQRYYVDNIREGLKEPGDWYLDRKTGILSYIPLPCEDIHTALIVAPVHLRIIEFHGDLSADNYVKNLHFKSLSFQHTEWHQSKTEIADSQAAQWLENGAIYLDGANNITFDNCEITHVGEYGLVLKQGCKNNTIRHCEISDTGAGGIVIGEFGSIGDLPNPRISSVSHNTTYNCFIHDGGQVFHNGAGIVIAKSSYNNIEHNEVSDYYYTGISVGMQWRGPPSTSNHNTIKYNHIHHIGQGVLGDLSGIYILDNPGTIISNNLIHNILNYPLSYGGFGIYLDENAENVSVENNIVHHTNSAALMTNGCINALVQNNIFAFTSTEGLIRRAMGKGSPSSWTITRNIFINHHIAPAGLQKQQGDSSSILWGKWEDKQHYKLDENIYYVFGEGMRPFFGKSFDEWRVYSGQDSNSIYGDPAFSNLDALNFSLKAESPARKVGFEPIATQEIGRYDWK
jgi:parallel beta-helix repeat protein